MIVMMKRGRKVFVRGTPFAGIAGIGSIGL